MAADRIPRLLDAAVTAINENAKHLTELDQAIGDGDHGINMKRGFDAIAASRGEVVPLAPPQALQKMGMTLVMKVGGASGPLYGSFLMAMGKALRENPNATDLATALAAGTAAVKQRGRSDVGAKTLLEVLVPVTDALRQAADEAAPVETILQRLVDAAEAGLESTRPMRATKGRASYLGERSVGHLDPGAASSCLLVKTLCQQWGTDS